MSRVYTEHPKEPPYTRSWNPGTPNPYFAAYSRSVMDILNDHLAHVDAMEFTLGADGVWRWIPENDWLGGRDG